MAWQMGKPTKRPRRSTGLLSRPLRSCAEGRNDGSKKHGIVSGHDLDEAMVGSFTGYGQRLKASASAGHGENIYIYIYMDTEI